MLNQRRLILLVSSLIAVLAIHAICWIAPIQPLAASADRRGKSATTDVVILPGMPTEAYAKLITLTLSTQERTYAPHEAILLKYEIRNTSANLSVEIGVRYGPHRVVSLEVARMGHAVPKRQGLLDPVGGPGNVRTIGPQSSYSGTIRLDEIYEINPGSQYVVRATKTATCTIGTLGNEAFPLLLVGEPIEIRVEEPRE